MDLDPKDIPHYGLQRKVLRLKAIVPNWSVKSLYDCLVARNGDYEKTKQFVEQESSEDELLLPSSAPNPAYQPKKTAQRKLNAPIKSIQQRFSTVRQSQAQAAPSPKKEQKKRRLVRGRPNATSDPSSQKAIHISSDEDEGIQNISSDESDAGMESEEIGRAHV